METHHSHKAIPKKTWGEYLLEFFMLFLAVFLGFIAENIREGSVERHREKEYMESLVKDLEFDTLNYSKTIRIIKRKIPYYDSVFLFMKNPASYNNKLPFRFYIKIDNEHFYTPAEPTISQLKNSGNLRLIQNRTVLDTILMYESRVSGAHLNQTNYVVEYNKRMVQLKEKVFDFINLNKFFDDQFTNAPTNESADYDMILTTKDPARLTELYNVCVATKGSEFFYINDLELTKKYAVHLIELIKHEYSLK